jgi:hypothetical protein
LQTIPAEIPYILPDPVRVQAWRAKLAVRPGHKVGLVWRGNPNNTDDRKRSIGAETIARLCAVPGSVFFALQIDAAAAEIGALAARGPVEDCGPFLTGWAETAALIASLDLVIAVDTAVAHLAGAMARPVWVLLSAAPHWCWPRDRADSPWHPTARLFRQTVPGDWAGVVVEIEQALRTLKQ